jgi:hypothetical protein
MSIITKITAAADNELARVEINWVEPGAGASVTFDVTVRTFPNQPAKDIEKSAVNEAARVANAFLSFYDKGT